MASEVADNFARIPARNWRSSPGFLHAPPFRYLSEILVSQKRSGSVAIDG